MKVLYSILILLLIPVINSCISDGQEDTGTNNDAVSTEEKEVVTPSEFADVAELLSKTEFTTKELNRITTFLNGKEVAITGYPYAYPLGEGKDVEFVPGTTEMIDGIDNSLDNVGVRIKFKDETEPRMMKIGELFGVKGKIEITYSVSESFGNTTRISIRDAEFLDLVQAEKGDVSSLKEVDLNYQIFLGDLYSIMDKHFKSLYDKSSITVSGAYYSTTVSKNYEGTEILEIRVDLGDSENKVGCELNEEPDDGLLKDKRAAGKDVSISGRFSGITFGNPRINGGVIK